MTNPQNKLTLALKEQKNLMTVKLPDVIYAVKRDTFVEVIETYHAMLLTAFKETVEAKVHPLCRCSVPDDVLNRCKECRLVIVDKRTANDILTDLLSLLHEAKKEI